MYRFYPRLRLLAAISFIGCAFAFGQRVLTLDDCFKIAIHENLTLHSADNTFQSAKLAKEEFGKSVLPQIKVAGKASHAPDSKNFGYDPAITDGGQYSAQLILQESIYDGARSIRSNQLQADVERTRAEQQKIERDLRYNVTVSFLNVLQAQSEMSLQLQRVDELTGYLDLVNHLSLGGGVNYTDLLKTEVICGNAKIGLKKSIQTYIGAKYSLAEIMGNPEDTAFAIEGSLGLPDSSVVDSLLRDSSIDSVQNIDLKIAGFDIQRSLFDIDIARSERLPSVLFSGDVGLLTSGDNLRLPADQRVSILGYSVGISVENLLFGWGMTDLRIQQHQLAAENMRLNYNQQRRGLLADLKRLRSQIESAIDQLNSISHTLKKAEENFTLAKAQYAGGGTTALEVLSAEQLLAENRLAEIQTRADLNRFLAKVVQLKQ